MDGTHINCNATAADRRAAWDHKGTVTQNCLAICSFDMRFLYIFSGWDGSAADSTMFNDACITDLLILPGKYSLADAGFPICDALLIPYWGARYHLENGVTLIFGKSCHCYATFCTNQNTVVPSTNLNCSTSGMHQHAMSSNASLVFSNGTSRFWYVHPKSV